MANERMREIWSKHGGLAWTENQRIFASAYAPFTAALVDALGDVAGLNVLDVGCGTGGLSQTIIDHGGVAVGIDISDTMLTTAREQVPAARFVVGDAQVAPLDEYAPDGFDVVTSEFGVMFFDDPVVAFANLAAATRPGGRLVFQCWRSMAQNPNFTNGVHLLAERMPEPLPMATPGSPGPTMFADPSYTTSTLTAAGWIDIAVEPFDAMCAFGIDGSDGVDERMALILANQTGRLASEQLPPLLGEAGWQALLDDVRAEVQSTMVDGVVAFPGATWIVSAVKPA